MTRESIRPLYLPLEQPDERVRLHSAECSSDEPETDVLIYGQLIVLAVVAAGLAIGLLLWLCGVVG